MKIVTTCTGKNTKLSNGEAMPAWRVGTSKNEMYSSCEKAKCAFLKGGHYVHPETGQRVREVTTIPGTFYKPEIVIDSNGDELIRLDTCFAVKGTLGFGMDKVGQIAGRTGLDGLKNQMKNRAFNCKSVRGAVVGNASTLLSRNQIETIDQTIRNQGLFHILYDHAWRLNPWILEYAVASCNHLKDVRDAIKQGATICSVVLPESMVNKYKGKRIDGYKMVKCPENCYTCGGSKAPPLCEAKERSKLVIMFTQHGHSSWKRRKEAIKKNIALASIADVKTRKAMKEKKIGPDGVRRHVMSLLERSDLKYRTQLTIEQMSERSSMIQIVKRAIKNCSKSQVKKYLEFGEIDE